MRLEWKTLRHFPFTQNPLEWKPSIAQFASVRSKSLGIQKSKTQFPFAENPLDFKIPLLSFPLFKIPSNSKLHYSLSLRSIALLSYPSLKTPSLNNPSIWKSLRSKYLDSQNCVTQYPFGHRIPSCQNSRRKRVIFPLGFWYRRDFGREEIRIEQKSMQFFGKKAAPLSNPEPLELRLRTSYSSSTFWVFGPWNSQLIFSFLYRTGGAQGGATANGEVDNGRGKASGPPSVSDYTLKCS